MANEHALEQKIDALRETIAWMDLVLANINEGILVLDKDWRIVFANTYIADAIDENRILILGKPFSEVLPGLAKNLIHKSLSQDIQCVHKLNGIFEIEKEKAIKEMVFQGRYVEKLQQAVCIVSDVSAEIKAEEAAMEFFKEIGALRQELISVKQSTK